jgi:hypothetical protein
VQKGDCCGAHASAARLATRPPRAKEARTARQATRTAAAAAGWTQPRGKRRARGPREQLQAARERAGRPARVSRGPRRVRRPAARCCLARRRDQRVRSGASGARARRKSGEPQRSGKRARTALARGGRRAARRAPATRRRRRHSGLGAQVLCVNKSLKVTWDPVPPRAPSPLPRLRPRISPQREIITRLRRTAPPSARALP